MAAILKITPKNHFCNGNSIGDMSGLEKHRKTFIKKLVLEDHGGGGCRRGYFTCPTKCIVDDNGDLDQ